MLSLFGFVALAFFIVFHGGRGADAFVFDTPI